MVVHEDLSHRQLRFRRLHRAYSDAAMDWALEREEIRTFVDDVRASVEHRPVMIFGNSFSHLAPLLVREFGDRMVLLKLTRNIVTASAARFAKQQPAWWRDPPPFEEDEFGNIPLPSDPNFHFKDLGRYQQSANLFEKVLMVNLDRSYSHEEMIELVPPDARLEIRSEDLFSQPELLQRIARTMDMETVSFDNLDIPRNSTWPRSLEEHPLRAAMVEDALNWPETQAMLTRMGNSLDEVTAKDIERKYGLPAGMGAAVRHHSNYWPIRRKVARFTRGLFGISAKTSLGETD